MSHKKSNEELRDARLIGELETARDSANWEAERQRQTEWMKAEAGDFFNVEEPTGPKRINPDRR